VKLYFSGIVFPRLQAEKYQGAQNIRLVLQEVSFHSGRLNLKARLLKTGLAHESIRPLPEPSSTKKAPEQAPASF